MHGVWFRRVGELGGLTDASQCRGIAENGPDVTLICQHHFSTGCTSHAIANTVTSLILSKKLRLLRTGCASPPQLCWFESLCSPVCCFAAVLDMPKRAAPWHESGRRPKRTAPWKNRLQQPHKARCMHANGQTPREIDVIRRRSQKVTTGRGMSGRVITQK